jgi:DNA-binding FrmR family transcriptional regulator
MREPHSSRIALAALNKVSAMPKSKFDDGRLILSRSPEERRPLLQRLSRIEGQVRGLKVMIEEDRYCPDELHQIKAAIAALKQVAVVLAAQHIAAAATHAFKRASQDTAREDMMRVIEEVLKF